MTMEHLEASFIYSSAIAGIVSAVYLSLAILEEYKEHKEKTVVTLYATLFALLANVIAGAFFVTILILYTKEICS